MSLRWGILSAGLISHDFCIGLSTLPKDEHEIIAVGARNEESAKAFAKTHGIPTSYGSYDELIRDPNVEVVYIGTIHPHHLTLAKQALDNGKHVLCEKPLCMNLKGTQELIDHAKKRKLFLMEAVWSRFFPAYIRLTEEIEKGSIGDVVQISVSFGMAVDGKKLKILKERGGGTTNDIGIYPVQLATLIFGGEKPLKILSSGHLNEEGVDLSTSTTLIYSGGRTATLNTHYVVDLPCEGLVIGTKGTLKLPKPFWCPDKLELASGETVQFPLPPTKFTMNYCNSTGLSYEAMEVRRCIRNGITESPGMTHGESLLLAEIMDSIKKQVGVSYE